MKFIKQVLHKCLAQAGYRISPALPLHDLPLMDLSTTLRRVAGADPILEQFIRFAVRHISSSHSQLLQDLFVDFVLCKRNGTFLEFGAFDGVTYSNTQFLESEREWRGVLVEPTPSLHAEIQKNRPLATLDRRCVFSHSGELVAFSEVGNGDLSTIRGFENSDHMARFRKTRQSHQVATVSLNDILSQHFCDGHADYVSIDTEGSEWEILSAFPFENRPSIFTIEHNFGPKRLDTEQLMERHGYVTVFREFTGFDGWFVSEDIWRDRFGGVPAR